MTDDASSARVRFVPHSVNWNAAVSHLPRTAGKEDAPASDGCYQRQLWGRKCRPHAECKGPFRPQCRLRRSMDFVTNPNSPGQSPRFLQERIPSIGASIRRLMSTSWSAYGKHSCSPHIAAQPSSRLRPEAECTGRWRVLVLLLVSLDFSYKKYQSFQSSRSEMRLPSPHQVSFRRRPIRCGRRADCPRSACREIPRALVTLVVTRSRGHTLGALLRPATGQIPTPPRHDRMPQGGRTRHDRQAGLRRACGVRPSLVPAARSSCADCASIPLAAPIRTRFEPGPRTRCGCWCVGRARPERARRGRRRAAPSRPAHRIPATARRESRRGPRQDGR